MKKKITYNHKLKIKKGDTVQIDIVLDTGKHSVLAGDVVLNYDQNIVKYVSTDKGVLPIDVIVSKQSNSGTLVLAALVEGTGGYKGKGVLSKLQFKGIADGATKLSFECKQGSTRDSNIAEDSIDADDVIDCSLNKESSIVVGSGAPIPTSGTCAKKGEGDYSCNMRCDLPDFEIFRREKTGMEIGTRSDGNGDGVVSMADFEVWRRCFLQSVVQN